MPELEIISLVEYACGNKKLSYSQTNSLFKADKEEKITKMTKRTTNVVVAIAAAVYKACKAVNAASVKKTLAMFEPIFKPESPILLSQGRFS